MSMAWTDERPLGTMCVKALSEPVGHSAPGNFNSILFLGSSSSGVQRYEVSQPLGTTAWTARPF